MRGDEEMANIASKNRKAKAKRMLIARIAARLRDKSILFYFDLIEMVKVTYRPPCTTGVKLEG
jgi:hypothetical protein